MNILERGHQAGLQEGQCREVFSSVQEGDYGVERGAQKLHLSVAEFEKKMQEAGYKIPETAESRVHPHYICLPWERERI